MIRYTTGDELFIKRIMAAPKVKQLLEMLYFYDEETYNHSIRVAYVAMYMCDRAKQENTPGADKLDKKKIVTAAILHDIGKMFVPHHILHKKTYLTEEEFAVIKDHPHLGAELARISSFPESVCEMIENHHKKMDGSGYPKGNNLPSEGAMLVSAADMFSAITEKRSYKEREDAETGVRFVYSEIENGRIPKSYGSLLESVVCEMMAVS